MRTTYGTVSRFPKTQPAETLCSLRPQSLNLEICLSEGSFFYKSLIISYLEVGDATHFAVRASGFCT